MNRTIEYCITIIFLIIAVPLLLIVAVIVLFSSGRPVFYFQERSGLNGTTFTIVKFRTMQDVSRPDGTQLSDEFRLDKIGKFLRASSLDELPELFNVLRGDMSLVGPRPLLMEYLPLYSTEQARRHEVRPGITGWAQVNGRNALSWEEKFKFDVWYVDHRSFWLDLRILAMTVFKIFVPQGINNQGHATMPIFLGTKDSCTEAKCKN